tara:strand:+ start:18372 stop:19379 length:1008 start_codon:yes stop_codon:yes gene_type:complete
MNDVLPFPKISRLSDAPDIASSDDPSHSPAVPEVERARLYAALERGASTTRAYEGDFSTFSRWCAPRGLKALPATPETVASFLASEADQGLNPATLTRRLAAIRATHVEQGHSNPAASAFVRATLKGIRRRHGRPASPKAAISAEMLFKMAEACPATPAGLRDRAILLLGFAGAFRRAELANLTREDLAISGEGVRITVRRAKSDQEGRGSLLAIPRCVSALCPVAALDDWLSASRITSGAIFRPLSKSGRLLDGALTGKSIAAIVKRYAQEVGLDASQIGGHSLRSGVLTAAAREGASVLDLMRLSRHKNAETLQGYVRAAEGFAQYPAKALFT